MRDKVVFAEVARVREQLRDREQMPEISPMALEVHVRALVRTAESPFPAFVPDPVLDDVAPPRVATMAALELCLSGLWDRASDGYVVSDLVTVERLARSALRRNLTSAGARSAALIRRSWRALNRETVVPL
ncbi:hypothetical protein [Mycolicibacterium palauense]|uniref:hypothetical protein n=1 Tax=Mycolicibacterium palauense TaxID=2034511 RepID=UPI00159BB9D5|nr:hypothetical protein [Mycolicibacterium palauense]